MEMENRSVFAGGRGSWGGTACLMGERVSLCGDEKVLELDRIQQFHSLVYCESCSVISDSL